MDSRKCMVGLSEVHGSDFGIAWMDLKTAIYMHHHAIHGYAPFGDNLGRLAARRDTSVAQYILQSFFHVLLNYTKAS